MPRYQLNFAIPEGKQERTTYEACATTFERLNKLAGMPRTKDVKVVEVHATGGSISGLAIVDAPNYEEAIRLVCSESPIFELEWHMEEEVDAQHMAKILQSGFRTRNN
jgi:hypothetical protein